MSPAAAADNPNVRVLAVIAIPFGFALYFVSIAAWQSPILLGVAVPLIVTAAAILAVIGAGGTKPKDRRRTHSLAVPLDDSPVLRIRGIDFDAEIVELHIEEDRRERAPARELNPMNV